MSSPTTSASGGKTRADSVHVADGHLEDSLAAVRRRSKLLAQDGQLQRLAEDGIQMQGVLFDEQVDTLEAGREGSTRSPLAPQGHPQIQHHAHRHHDEHGQEQRPHRVGDQRWRPARVSPSTRDPPAPAGGGRIGG